MSPGGHLITTAAACAGVYLGTGNAALTAGLAVGGFLIDVDHVFDYLVFEKQLSLDPSRFLRYYLEGRVQRVVLPLHSYELLVVLALMAWLSGRDWLWGYVAGTALHLVLDVVWNGRLVPGGLVHFYSFACRAHARFRADHFADRSRLATLEENFWVSFFCGARLKAGAATAEAMGRPVLTRTARAPR